ncbi:very-long-chain (3R)-3-hydroxyacyl-CoA dehydratase 2 [Venturia canescens]|uniref:very-long-chain (3R)-3-hydroxyacyl-CoA dehydratase 2 n=1 Tax=Venturia canescens TaxID=32260 RepID=UPI001C9C880D|nr:very-long-chain (3R)-3-hydroxyacyl-CoA dehydratase 2 [Venturia canescens]
MAYNKASEKSREPGTLAKLYLKAYNFSLVLGWSYILYVLIQYQLGIGGDEHLGKSLWDVVGFSVIVFQNAAVLEILNASIGLVRSNPVITTFQVLSRVMVVCGVLLATPLDYAASSPGLPIALLAWSVTEIIRYAYYFTSLMGFVPHFIVFLRYTTFIALYPIGVTGELLCFYWAQMYARDFPDAWSYALPNPWNFTFSYRYFLISVMLLYIPLFPQMYLHMFAQRRKVLGTPTEKNKKIA